MTMIPFVAHIHDRLGRSPFLLRLFRGIFWAMIGTALTRVFSMATTIFIARFLGRELYGSYGMVESTIGMFGMFAGLAMGSTMAKFVAEFRGKDPVRAGRIMSLGRTFSLLTAAAIALALYLFSAWLAENTLNRPDLAPLLRIGALLLLVSTLNNVETGSLAGFEAFKEVARINMIQGIATPLLTIPLVYLYGLPGAFLSMVGIAVVGYIAALRAVLMSCRTNGIRLRYFDPAAMAELRVIWTFSIPATLSGILYIPVIWITNTLLVNQHNGYAELGLFNAANQWRHFIIVIPNILSFVMLPILSEAFGRENRLEFQHAFRVNLEITWAVALPATAAVMGFSKPLAGLFGNQYAASVPIIAVLMSTAFLNIVNNVVGTALVGSGRMWTGSLFNLAWAVTLIVATSFLVPTHGGMGLAFAYLIAYVLHSLWQMAYLERKLAPTSITGQKMLIGVSLATLVPIYFLGTAAEPFYFLNAAVVLLSSVPLLRLGWKFVKARKPSMGSNRCADLV